MVDRRNNVEKTVICQSLRIKKTNDIDFSEAHDI